MLHLGMGLPPGLCWGQAKFLGGTHLEAKFFLGGKVFLGGQLGSTIGSVNDINVYLFQLYFFQILGNGGMYDPAVLSDPTFGPGIHKTTVAFPSFVVS